MAISASEQVIRSLYRITSAYRKGFDYQLQQLLELGCERFDMEIGILAEVQKDHYRVVQCQCPEGTDLHPGDQFELNNTYCVETLKAEGPLGFHHMATSRLCTHPAYRTFKLEAYIGTPVEVDGEIFGTLNFSSPTPKERQFNEIDIDALQLMAIWVGGELARLRAQQALERSNRALQQSREELKQANYKLRKLALLDPLTQIPNRRQLDRSLHEQHAWARRHQKPLSLVMIDIDDFKLFNDRFGHETGDQVLCHCANILQQGLRPSDLLARFGGEEFTLLLPETSSGQALEIAERLRAELERSPWNKHRISASFGVACYTPGDKELSEEALIRTADKALYCAKQHGKNRVKQACDCPHAECSGFIARTSAVDA